MGNCRSCEVAAAAAAASTVMASPTAKLVLQDDELLEFESPVSAAQVLQKQQQPGCFICNADDMDFDGVGASEELHPGQLYFLLPRSMLRRRLHPDEMAALAVRASSALMKCRSRRGSSSVAPVTFTGRPPPRPAAAEEHRKRHRRAGSSGKGRDFTSELGAIPETPEQ